MRTTAAIICEGKQAGVPGGPRGQTRAGPGAGLLLDKGAAVHLAVKRLWAAVHHTLVHASGRQPRQLAFDWRPGRQVHRYLRGPNVAAVSLRCCLHSPLPALPSWLRTAYRRLQGQST